MSAVSKQTLTQISPTSELGSPKKYFTKEILTSELDSSMNF